MPSKVISLKINNEEVKNPLAKLLISLFAVIVLLLFLALVLLVFLPLVWLMAAMIVATVVLVIVSGPRILKQYRIVVIEKKGQTRHDKLQ